MSEPLTSFKDLRVAEIRPQIAFKFKGSLTESILTLATGSGTVTVANSCH